MFGKSNFIPTQDSLNNSSSDSDGDSPNLHINQHHQQRQTTFTLDKVHNKADNPQNHLYSTSEDSEPDLIFNPRNQKSKKRKLFFLDNSTITNASSSDPDQQMRDPPKHANKRYYQSKTSLSSSSESSDQDVVAKQRPRSSNRLQVFLTDQVTSEDGCSSVSDHKTHDVHHIRGGNGGDDDFPELSPLLPPPPTSCDMSGCNIHGEYLLERILFSLGLILFYF